MTHELKQVVKIQIGEWKCTILPLGPALTFKTKVGKRWVCADDDWYLCQMPASIRASFDALLLPLGTEV